VEENTGAKPVLTQLPAHKTPTARSLCFYISKCQEVSVTIVVLFVLLISQYADTCYRAL
jgi:hypothetical protein